MVKVISKTKCLQNYLCKALPTINMLIKKNMCFIYTKDIFNIEIHHKFVVYSFMFDERVGYCTIL